jgi:spore maturation protein SpmA
VAALDGGGRYAAVGIAVFDFAEVHIQLETLEMLAMWLCFVKISL